MFCSGDSRQEVNSTVAMHIKESVMVDITVHAHSTGRQNRVRIVFLHFNINIVIVSGKIHFLSGQTIMQGKRQTWTPGPRTTFWTCSMDYTREPLSWTSRKIFPITDHRVKHYEAEICISQQPQSFKE